MTNHYHALYQKRRILLKESFLVFFANLSGFVPLIGFFSRRK